MQIMANQRKECAVAFLEAAAAYYSKLGDSGAAEAGLGLGATPLVLPRMRCALGDHAQHFALITANDAELRQSSGIQVRHIIAKRAELVRVGLWRDAGVRSRLYGCI